jgi:AraC family transcriptional regulator
MSLYLQLLQESLNYIEDHLDAPIRVEEVSQHVYLSAFHFNRLFKTAVGLSPKQYILGRKMTLAQTRLKETRDSLINIALGLGFEYPEVFSRAFKKQFGISPRSYRSQKPAVPGLPKAELIVRDWMNYQGALVIKAEFVELPALELEGLVGEVNLRQPGYEQKLRALGQHFETASAGQNHLNPRRFFSVVNCHGGDDDGYDVFIGREACMPAERRKLDLRQVPAGWYARFDYQGDMVDIRSTFVDDLFRWILVKGIQLAPNGVGMLTRYDDETYFTTQAVSIFVPVTEESARVQQKTS